MDEQGLQSRLSRISTIWELVAASPVSVPRTASDAWFPLIQRYQGAAYRYLLKSVRDPGTADDLFQEFALRCIQGAFRNADPQRGRFRDYLKTILYHLIVDHERKLRKRPRSLTDESNQPVVEDNLPQAVDEQFLESWQKDLLARAWTALAQIEQQGGPPFHSVLKYRADNPGADSADMADHLTQSLRPQVAFTSAGIRKTLQRARARFADALLDEVAHSLGTCTVEDLEQELIDVGLLPYCRAALDRRRRGR